MEEIDLAMSGQDKCKYDISLKFTPLGEETAFHPGSRDRVLHTRQNEELYSHGALRLVVTPSWDALGEGGGGGVKGEMAKDHTFLHFFLTLP